MKKTLTVRFGRSISAATNRPETIEVVVTPLSSASSPDGDVTYVAEKEVRTVPLAHEVNEVTFDLIPSYMPGLNEPILYRIAWRKEFVGKIESFEFSMPDFDTDLDDLRSLGHIITGENYLREGDLGVPGRVARLNRDGQVIDSEGNVVGAGAETELAARLDQEIINRQDQGVAVRNDAYRYTDTRTSSVSRSLNNTITANRERIESDLSDERQERTSADQQIVAQINALDSRLTDRAGQAESDIQRIDSDLSEKADLRGGKLRDEQVPDLALTRAVRVSSEAEMLSLTTDQVQPGDMAVRPDGTWILDAPIPSNKGSWIKLSSGGGVVSVNGKTGEVSLDASDVGARKDGVPIPQSHITGLSSSLSNKANTSDVVSVQTTVAGVITDVEGLKGRVEGLEDHAVIVDEHGEVDSGIIKEDIPRVDPSTMQLRLKDGSVIPIGGSGGGGDVISVNGMTGAVVLSASDVGARSSSQPVPIDSVDGLSAALDTKATKGELQSTNTRVSRLETDVEDILATGGGGSGGGGSRTAVTWVADDPENPSYISIRSPFGISDGIPYYDAEGAAAGEAVFPHITPNGSLVFRTLDPDAPPEPDLATEQSVLDLEQRVSTLEQNPSGGSGSGKPSGGWARTDLTEDIQGVIETVEGATSSSLSDSLVARNSAGTFSVSEPTNNSHPATKRYVDQVADGFATEADLSALQVSVSGKADASDLSSLTGRVDSAFSALESKADLSQGTVPVGQVPDIPASKIIGLTSALSNKADLENGKIAPSQMPSIDKESIEGLTEALSAKADLVDGKIRPEQIGRVATTETFTVQTKAQMLDLTDEQVQPGDIAMITGDIDKGSYILAHPDPSDEDSWIALASHDGLVSSVNGKTGDVTLSASDVGARPTGVKLSQSDITGLTGALNDRVTQAHLNDALSGLATPEDVADQVSESSPVRMSVDYVATSAVGSTSGQQSIDGVLVPLNSRVLLTKQSASSRNGIWVVNTGSWTRPSDTPPGAKFTPGTIVAVKKGSEHADSLWQLITATPGDVDTNQQHWEKIMRGGVQTQFTAGNGITITNNKIAAKAGNGIIIDSSGVRLDYSAVPRKFVVTLPAGPAITTINHGLGTRDLTWSIRDAYTNEYVLAGITAVDNNNVSIEFNSPIAAGQWVVTLIG